MARPSRRNSGEQISCVTHEQRTVFDVTTHRHGRCDDHHRLGVDGHHVLNEGFDGAGVEVVGLVVIVAGGGDDEQVVTVICFLLVECGTQGSGIYSIGSLLFRHLQWANAYG